MRQHREGICPNCHQELIDGKPSGTSHVGDDAMETGDKPTDDREYDHRGIALPRRTRMGGIITPQ